ncbi:MAG: hypothetical protein KA206_00845 [Paludibacter sp.]|nr:hypothetical protein [Paludibacter sp.]
MKQTNSIKKNVISLMCCVCIITANAATYSGGTGTAVDPYLLSNKADITTLVNTTADWGMQFKLTADVDMAGETFHPIGNNASAFTGGFDGNSMVVKNLTITPSATQNNMAVGFFGKIQNATIKNLGIINLTIDVKTTHERVGGIVGISEWNASLIQNCFVLGGSIAGQGRVGGIVGVINDNGSVIDCFAKANVSDAWGSVGGIVGEIPSWSTGASLTNVAFYGEMGNGNAIAGVKSGTISRAYYVQSIGKNSDTNGTELTTTQLQTEANYVGFDFASKWKIIANNFAVLKSFSNTVYSGLSTSIENTTISSSENCKIYTLNSQIILPANTSEVKVISLNGMPLFQSAVAVTTINTALLQKGICILKLKTTTGESIVQKLTLN